MAWVAVDKDGEEYIYEHKPSRDKILMVYLNVEETNYVTLPKGSIKKLIGRDLTWEDNPVELKEE